MKKYVFLFGVIASLTIALLLTNSSLANAGIERVEVCHIPPDDPDSFHTLNVEKDHALPLHLAHGDLIGPCGDYAEDLCDDNNECTRNTIDDKGKCDNSQPVDCDDTNACTTETCDPNIGCIYTTVTCPQGSDLCVPSICDPTDGSCNDTPISCSSGETCEPATGQCLPDSSGTCPCGSALDWHGWDNVGNGSYDDTNTNYIYEDQSGNGSVFAIRFYLYQNSCRAEIDSYEPGNPDCDFDGRCLRSYDYPIGSDADYDACLSYFNP